MSKNTESGGGLMLTYQLYAHNFEVLLSFGMPFRKAHTVPLGLGNTWPFTPALPA